MKHLINSILLTTTLLTQTIYAKSENFLDKKDVQLFIEELVNNDGLSKEKLTKLFRSVEIQKDSLSFYTKKNKGDYKSYTWEKYSKSFLSDKKVKAGVEFLKKYNKYIHKAYQEYKIPGEYIVAIIGIESNYGGYMGHHGVFDTLSTLAFKKNRRNSFFKKELKAYLKMTKREKVNPKEIKGSFAGAIGYSQFMPSNFKRVAVDLDNNGSIRLDKPHDAIGSVANYFKISGWKLGVPVATRVSYEGTRFSKYKTGYKTKYKRNELEGIKPKKRFFYNGDITLVKLKKEKYDELWYGSHNFKVITTYNHSEYYAMSVHMLAQKIKAKLKKQRAKN